MERSLEIIDLPDEMLLEIFEKMKLHEIMIHCADVCPHWADLIAQYILGSGIHKLANANPKFKMDIKDAGWMEDSINKSDLILSLYPKYEQWCNTPISTINSHCQ